MEATLRYGLNFLQEYQAELHAARVPLRWTEQPLQSDQLATWEIGSPAAGLARVRLLEDLVWELRCFAPDAVCLDITHYRTPAGAFQGGEHFIEAHSRRGRRET